jgi:hypothetical protein
MIIRDMLYYLVRCTTEAINDAVLDLIFFNLFPLQVPPNADYRQIELEEGFIGDTNKDADESYSNGEEPFGVWLPLGDSIYEIT